MGMIDSDKRSSPSEQTFEQARVPENKREIFGDVPGISEELRAACSMLASTPIVERHGAPFSTDFQLCFAREILASSWFSLRQLKKAISDKPFVDLCSGGFPNPDQGAASIARKFSVSAYIGVDLCTRNKDWSAHVDNRMGLISVNADTKTFLESIPKKSSNIYMSGIDYFVWNPEDMPSGYVESVASLMLSRVCKGGIILLDRVSADRVALIDQVNKNHRVEKFRSGGMAVFCI
jgi:hypothetical protein